MALQDITLQTIQQNKLIPEGGTVIVAVSGGPDSFALLHVLNQLHVKLACRLHVATFDHQLRGESSADDVRYVEQIGKAWGIAVSTGQANVRQIAEASNVSTEVAGRQARYAFLARVAREVGAVRVAVAHHADDQAETVLMHIIRGAGLDGLGGMALQSAVPEHPDLMLIRPFLNVTRAQIEAYCAEHGLVPREDVTNRDISLLRNNIRWNTLPHLEKLNPSIRRALVQLADIAGVERDYMERQLRRVIERHVIPEQGSIAIERSVFCDLHPALQRRYVYWAARQVAPGSTDTGYVHVVAAVELGLQGRVGAIALLSGGIRLRVDYKTLVIERMKEAPNLPDIPLLNEGTEIRLIVPGVTLPPGNGWRLRVSTNPEDMIHPAARLSIPEGSEVVLRTWHKGDRFAPLGMAGRTQKVGRWMINRKVPRLIRDRIPILSVDEQIAAIATGETWAISHGFAVEDTGHTGMYFLWEKNER